MTNKKLTKKALLSSVLSLVLCMALLIGATFAWFTDSVTSKNNIIKSGKLKVSMEYADGTKAVPDKDSADWVDASAGPMFTYNLWEPGYTEVYHIKIENEGTLALCYQLSITNADGTTFKAGDLAEVIDVYYVDPAQQVAGRTDLVEEAKLGTLAEVLGAMDETAAGKLLAGENHTITLALKMQESAGNEYQNKSVGEGFSVVLVATQVEAEADSFGDDYDKGLMPLNDGDVLKEENNIQYVYTPDGEVYLYLVTEDYADDTVVVPEGVTAIGNYAFAYNSNVKNVELSSTVRSLGRGFDSSGVEKVVLNEGLEKIDSRAFKSTPNLKEVQISSTVKVIEDNAFQKSGIKNIVIPANVETVGEAAFGSSKIETVTFEGNTSIQGYAFRGCPNLRTVYLNGDDTTFIASTLNGRNSMWFCNGESNNPNTSNITFYVKNTTVAQRVKTAMGAEAGNTPVYVDESEVVFVKNTSELDKALDTNKDTIIEFTADITGDVEATQQAGADVVVDGKGYKFTGVMTVFGQGEQSGKETFTIQNVNFVAAEGADACIVSPDRSVHNKYSYAHNVTVANCTFTDPNGGFDCAAIRHEDGGDKNWVIKNCEVDETMHSFLQVNNVIGKLTIVDCAVSSKNGANLNSCTNVEITGSTFNVKGYAVRFGVKTGGNFGEAKNYVISNCKLTSANDDGDAVIMFRASATDAVLTLSNTTLNGTPQISGNTADTTINQ